MKIFSITGRLIRIIDNNTTSKIKIEKGNLIGGIYFIQLFNDRQIISNGKLIIE